MSVRARTDGPGAANRSDVVSNACPPEAESLPLNFCGCRHVSPAALMRVLYTGPLYPNRAPVPPSGTWQTCRGQGRVSEFRNANVMPRLASPRRASGTSTCSKIGDVRAIAMPLALSQGLSDDDIAAFGAEGLYRVADFRVSRGRSAACRLRHDHQRHHPNRRGRHPRRPRRDLYDPDPKRPANRRDARLADAEQERKRAAD